MQYSVDLWRFNIDVTFIWVFPNISLSLMLGKLYTQFIYHRKKPFRPLRMVHVSNCLNFIRISGARGDAVG